MLCAISGEAPQEPVASKKSGQIFEKRLIESYIAENGCEPITGEILAVDDLIALKSARAVKPRPPTLTSIPSLLSVFQNEWDAVALETFQLKQNLTQLQQELSLALYNCDAANRVIVRLTKERDEARDALTKVPVGQQRSDASSTAPSSTAATSTADVMQVDAAALPATLQKKVEEVHQRLSSTRRKRQLPDEWATVNEIRSYRPSQPTRLVSAGSHALAAGKDPNFAFCGGLDGEACIYSFPKQETVRVIQAGAVGINDIVSLESASGLRFVIATAAGEIKMFDNETELCGHTAHSGAAEAVSMHPCQELLGSVGADKSFAMYDVKAKEVLTQVYTKSKLTTCAFHPDGHLFACGGESGEILIFQTTTGTSAASFAVGGPIQNLAFSENGTWLAVAIQGSSTVSIWDLRKASAIHTLDFGFKVESIEWDYSGQFLAGAGPNGVSVKCYEKASKEWSEPFQKAVGAKIICWGVLAKALIALTTDGSIGVIK